MKGSALEPLRITELVLQNWMNFTKVQVELRHRAFLVGPNASGKSNLLDAVRFLRDIVRVGGGFQEAVRRRGGVSVLRCLAARQVPDVLIRVRIGTDLEPDQWAYEIKFRQNGKQRAVVSSERVWRRDEEILTRPDRSDTGDPERLSQTHLQQVGTNQRFRAIAEFLESVRYLHLVPQLVRDPERSIAVSDDPFGGDFLDQVASTPKRTREKRLRIIAAALRIAVPQLSALELQPDDQGRPHLKGKYEHWRPQGAWQTERQFSDGTLRLLGLLWATLDSGGPLLLEEPELSLHPGVIRHLPRLFARIQHQVARQMLISTHSPELLRDDGIGLDEVLLLTPDREGATVTLASKMEDVADLLHGGLSLPDVVLPRTEPKQARQLSLFDAV
jgi:predicted ATPase